MDLNQALKELAEKVREHHQSVETEEATKQAFIIPFIRALGYDVFNPKEVVPEYTTDVGVKKGEKVDYAIIKDGEPIILIECKWCGSQLSEQHFSQLFRYFSVTDARIAVLSNGIQYQFYTDLDKPNTMDSKPFLELDLLNLNDGSIQEIQKLAKNHFDENEISARARELKYTKAIKEILQKEMEEPSDEFTRFFTSQIYTGRLTQNILKEFRELIKRSMNSWINDEINQRLQSVINPEETQTEKNHLLDISPYMSKKQKDDERIETTDEEAQGFLIVLDILSKQVDANRIFWRDVINYFNILLDDNKNKPICRLYFNGAKKYIGLFDQPDRKEEKVLIQRIEDIQQYAPRLLKTLQHYD